MDKLYYYEVLGLNRNATAADIEASYLALSQFLEPNNVPARLRTWAASQAGLVDEAYAALVGAGDDEPEALAAPPPRQSSPATLAGSTVQPRTTKVRPRDDADDGEDEDFDDDEYFDEASSKDYEEDDDEIRRPMTAKAYGRPASAVAKSGGRTVDKPRWQEGHRRRSRGRSQPEVQYRRPVQRGDDRTKRILIGLGGGIVVLLVAYLAAVQMRLGPFTDSGLGGSQADQAIPINQARYNQLLAVADGDPKNFEAVFELGQMTFEAQRYEESITWLEKALALRPDDVWSLLDLGTANFNLGNRDKVVEPWQKALALDPNNPQTHWNLGFYYASEQPPDLDSAMQEWQTVVKLTKPGDQLYKLAQTHIEQYKSKVTGSP